MATKLRKLVLNEVSLVDRGANPGAVITLFKRHVPEEDEITCDNVEMTPAVVADPNVVAKSAEDAVADAKARIIKMAHDIAGGADNYVSRSNWYGVLKALAEQRRGPTETSAQAFTKFVTGDPDGRALFAALRSASGPDFVPEPVTPAPVLKHGTAYTSLRAIAAELQKADPKLTQYTAFAKAFAANPELAARSKTEQAFT